MSVSFHLISLYLSLRVSQVFNRSVILETSQHEVPIFRVRMVPSVSLTMSRYAEDYILKRLPATFEESPGAYQSFIDYWGTHYYSRAHFGGVVRVGIA